MPHTFKQASGVFLQLSDPTQGVGKSCRASLEAAAKKIEEEAKAVIGTYAYGWPRLQPETVARKAGGDTPLLETGELRDSIEHFVDPSGPPYKAYVGSNNPKALWHELGTVHIPARSFLMASAMRLERQITEDTHKHIAGDIAQILEYGFVLYAYG